MALTDVASRIYKCHVNMYMNQIPELYYPGLLTTQLLDIIRAPSVIKLDTQDTKLVILKGKIRYK